MLSELLKSVSRACYVLIFLEFVSRTFHRLFPKTDYDYDRAQLYIIAYYPPKGKAVLIFKSDLVCPETLQWMKDVQHRIQEYVSSGAVRLVTEAVPMAEVNTGATGFDVVRTMCDNGVRDKVGLSALFIQMAMEYAAIKAKYETAG